jgi:hypothetical protein
MGVDDEALKEKRANLARAARAARRSVAELARRDPNAFCQFVLRDERTGKRIKQAPMHRRWQTLMSDYPRLVFWAHVDAGKTNQLSVGRVLWELGRNPNLRIAVISKTSALAMKIVRSVAQYIEKSDALHEVFPHLRPARDASLPWTSYQLTVERTVTAKDPSVQACGNYGNIQGARIDLLLMDDILDFENTRTATPREHLWQWIRGTLFGRLTEAARILFVANAFHPDDAAHRMAREAAFMAFRFPVVDEAGTLTWPEHWSAQRIAEQREIMGPLEFSRALLCQARDDETSRFKRQYIDKATSAGQGLSLLSCAADWIAEVDPAHAQEVAASESIRRLGLPVGAMLMPSLPAGYRIYTGVDLAVQKHAAADMTVLFTIGIYPDGRRRVLEILSGRWAAPEIIDKIRDAYARWGSVFIVENNAAQQYIVDLVQEGTAVPVIPFTTGRQKAHPEFGVEGLAAEFNSGKWVVPSGADGKSRGKEIDAWLIELLNYDPTAHTGDRLMASWFAREGARSADTMHVGVSASVLGGAKPPARVLLGETADEDISFD